MSRNPGKHKKNFACQMDAEVFDRLSRYCDIAHQSKTSVVEQAVIKYLEDNFEKMPLSNSSICRLCSSVP